MDVKDNIADEFNAFSVNYTADMIACVPYYKPLISCFTKHIDEDFVPSKILDLGCGNGNVSADLSNVFPDAHYTLVDASNEMLKICNNRFEKINVNTVESYFQSYLFPENHFEMVVAGFSLHHCKDDQKKDLINKIYKSLTRGGIFMCADLMIDKNTLAHDLLIEKWKSFVNESFPDGEKWKWIMEHYLEFDHPSSRENHSKWLNSAGFVETKFEFFEDYWSFFIATKI